MLSHWDVHASNRARQAATASSRLYLFVFSQIFAPIQCGGFGGVTGGQVAVSGTSAISEAAQRYAVAVFDLALDVGAVDAVETGLTDLARVIAGNVELSAVLRSPLHKSEEKAAVLAAIGDKLKMHDLARRFVGVAALNRRAGDIPGMAKAFAERAARHRGATRVTARVARPITKDQTLELESTVSKSLGRTVTVDVEVDPALIGGLQIKMGSRLVDASIRTKLNALTTLMKGA